MDWQTSSQYARRALSEAKMGETGVYYGKALLGISSGIF